MPARRFVAPISSPCPVLLKPLVWIALILGVAVIVMLISLLPARGSGEEAAGGIAGNAPADTAAGAMTELSLSDMSTYSREDCARLNAGEVVVDLIEETTSKTKFVAGRIMIDDTPENVWHILVNPFEFERKITPRMKTVEVLTDEERLSVLKCTIEVCFLFPPISYTVESIYDPLKEVRFKRIGGTLKDFRGKWVLIPVNEKQTIVLYSMFVDPGMPIPKWLVREGVKMELPGTLKGLRNRVYALKQHPESEETRSILAVRARTASGVAVTGTSR